MHHRAPTSSENTLKQTHPIITSNKELQYDYITIHNGVINNAELLKDKHEKMQYKYTTKEKNKYSEIEYNDSEALAIELARYIENKIDIMDINGYASFMVIQVNKKTKKINKIFFGKDSERATLKLRMNENNIYISSEGPGYQIKKKMLYSFSMDELKIKIEKMNYKKQIQQPIISAYYKTPGINAPYNYDYYEHHPNYIQEKQSNTKPSTLQITEYSPDSPYAPEESAISINADLEKMVANKMDIIQNTILDYTEEILDPTLINTITEDQVINSIRPYIKEMIEKSKLMHIKLNSEI